MLRQLLVPRNQAIWRWYPWLLLLSFVMLMILVQWKMHKNPSRLLQYHRSTTRPLYTWCVASNSAFCTWQMSISEAKWTFAPFVFASSITSFLLLTFARFHFEFLQFLNSLSIAAYAAGIFHSLPLPATWSSWWFGNVSPIRILVDSLASRIHANFDLISLVLPRVSTCLLFLLVLQAKAGAIGVSKFLRAFLMVSLSSWSMKLFVRPHLLLLKLGILSHFIQSSGHKWSGRDVSCFLINLSISSKYPFQHYSSPFCWSYAMTLRSRQQILSSGFNVDASRHLFSGDEMNVALWCSVNFNTFLASFHAASRAPCSCHSVSSCERSSNFGALELRSWGAPGQM